MAFQTQDGKFLGSLNTGDIEAFSGTFVDRRRLKLFKIKEVYLPAHMSLRCPMRCYLQTKRGFYLSNCGNVLNCNATVPCCTENLVIELPIVTKLEGGKACSEDCILWTGDCDQVMSRNEENNRVTVRSQHSCLGSEQWSLKFWSGGFVQVSQQLNELKAVNLTLNQGMVACLGNRKPTPFKICIENDSALLLSATGSYLTPSYPFRTANGRMMSHLKSTDICKSSFDALDWKMEYHGDDIYSIINNHTGQELRMMSNGNLCLCRAEDWPEAFPDPSTIFRVSLEKIDVDEEMYLDTNDNEYSVCLKDNFFSPTRSSALLGFKIRSMIKVDGHYLRLSILPGNRITTTFDDKPIKRWDLFHIVDKTACINGFFRHLESKPLIRMPTSCGSEKDAFEMTSSSADVPPITDTKYTKIGPRRLALATMKLTEKHWPLQSAASLQDICTNVIATSIVKMYKQCVKHKKPNRLQNIEASLTDDMCNQILQMVEVSMSSVSSSTKLCIRTLAENKGLGSTDLPEWIKSKIIMDLDTILNDTSDAYLCSNCCGKSSILIPMDPVLNPKHHRFLSEMVRMRFGGVRRRAVRENHSDGILFGLKFLRNAVVCAGVAKCLIALA